MRRSAGFPLMWSAKPPISWRIRGSESISGIVWCRGLSVTDVARKLNTRYWTLARVAMTALNQFICSADVAPGMQHMPPPDEMKGMSPQDALRAVQILWHEMSNPDGNFSGHSRHLSEALSAFLTGSVTQVGYDPF